MSKGDRSGPEFAPIEGVSFRTYARLLAIQVEELPQAEWIAELAKHGLDLASYQRVATAWTARLDGRYPELHVALYEAMREGDGEHAKIYDTASLSLETLAEMQVAALAASHDGSDYIGLVRQRLGLSVAEYHSAIRGISDRVGRDLKTMQRYAELFEHFRKQYGLDRDISPDDDIVF